MQHPEYNVEDLVTGAQLRWLRPSEVFFILVNHEGHRFTEQLPHRPPTGSLFLYNRRVLKSFRRDGHKWRKKRDGKAVREAHERLKVGSAEALSCYYAHGEENPNFQRRCYWMLDPSYKDIVLVHYRDVKEGLRVHGFPALPTLQSSPGSSSDTSHQSDSYVSPFPSLHSAESSYQNLCGITDSGAANHGNSGESDELMEALRKLEQQLSLNDDPDSFSALLGCGGGGGVGSPTEHPSFVIQEVSPGWGYAAETTRVVIVGCGISECVRGCAFDGLEVEVEAVREGVFVCHVPPHRPGMANLFLTDGGGVPCSQVREFEYRSMPGKTREELLLLVRLARMLLPAPDSGSSWSDVIDDLPVGNGASDCDGRTTDWLLQKLLRDKLDWWVFHRRCRDPPSRGFSGDERGIIHAFAGLGFEWALDPILQSGVGVNFRDVNGWTALHWAARFGREKMVAALVARGASAGAVTDPNSADRAGRTAASVAELGGHFGLAGYLSELALTAHLASLEEHHLEEADLVKTEDCQPLRSTLAAVRNASQAAARIQSAFRAHSFRKRHEASEDHARHLSIVSRLAFHNARSAAAAVSIQKRYQGSRDRRAFLALRQKVIRIQAHVRGHQARKKFRMMCWAVGVVEKIVLRWRRRGSGLRGFRPDPKFGGSDDDDSGGGGDDIINSFRKETVETAINEAVLRVRSMVDSSEAREQYARMIHRFHQAKADLTGMAADIGEC